MPPQKEREEYPAAQAVQVHFHAAACQVQNHEKGSMLRERREGTLRRQVDRPEQETSIRVGTTFLCFFVLGPATARRPRSSSAWAAWAAEAPRLPTFCYF